MALPYKNRLTLSVRSAFRGKRIKKDGFTIIVKFRKGIFKAAIVVSKKTAQKATDRNRIRRLFTESIRTNLQKIRFQGEIMIIVTKNMANLTKNQIETKLISTINKL